MGKEGEKSKIKTPPIQNGEYIIHADEKYIFKLEPYQRLEKPIRFKADNIRNNIDIVIVRDLHGKEFYMRCFKSNEQIPDKNIQYKKVKFVFREN